MDPFEVMGDQPPEHLIFWSDPASGLRAALVLDSTALGPAAGGIRTRAYDTVAEGVADAAALARAMTLKCALAGLDAGGGKAVVLAHPGMDREAAFEALGRRVEALGGLFRTAGDLGTTEDDLRAAARHTGFVHLDGASLAAAVARGLWRCMEASAGAAGRVPSVRGLRVAIQGCGDIGQAAAAKLAAEGASLLVADVDPARAEAVARATGATVVEPDAVLSCEVDIVAPCAVGGVLTPALVPHLRAWAVCGAANNILASPEAERALLARGLWFVPDIIASAGAVVDGIGRTVMGLDDRTALIDALGATAAEVLARAAASGQTPTEVAHQRARARVAAASR